MVWIDWATTNPNPQLAIVNEITGAVILNTTESTGTAFFGPFAEDQGYSYSITDLTLSGCSVFKSVSSVSCTVTPIELVALTGEILGDVNQLAWVTGSEFENDYFTIERSVNGVDFETLAFVESQGDANARQDYQFVDQNPLKQSYYRLLETDLNGNTSIAYSVIYLERENESFEILLTYPSPARDNLNVKLQSLEEENVSVQIYNSLGQLISQEEHFVRSGINTLNVDVSRFVAGNYILNLISNQHGSQQISVIKRY